MTLHYKAIQIHIYTELTVVMKNTQLFSLCSKILLIKHSKALQLC